VLASFTITLVRISETRGVPDTNVGLTSSELYELIRSIPGVAKDVHPDTLDAPLTVSPPMPLRPRQDGVERYRVRLTTMNEPVFDTLCRALYAEYRSEKALHCSGGGFAVTSLDFTDRRGMCQLATYDSLMCAESMRRLEFKFLTPTTFGNGKSSVSLPMPRPVFQSYLARWNRFAPPELAIPDGLLEEVEKHVLTMKHTLTTRVLDVNGTEQTGFVGRCTFAIGRGINRDSACLISALARFAMFSGTGANTAFGMGQTLLA
jgi:CRISPR-associated endoribonuclease Cas6